MYKILFTAKAEKEISKLARSDSKRLIKKLSKLTYPFPKSFDIKKMQTVESFYRLRFGRIRLLFEINFNQRTIWIRKIGYRGGFY